MEDLDAIEGAGAVDDYIPVDRISAFFSIGDGSLSKSARYAFKGWALCTEIMPLLEQIKMDFCDIAKCEVKRDDSGTSYDFKLFPGLMSSTWRELSAVIGAWKILDINKQSLRVISSIAREHATRRKQAEIQAALREAFENLRSCKEDKDRKELLGTIAELADQQRAADPWKKPNDYATRVSPWRAKA